MIYLYYSSTSVQNLFPITVPVETKIFILLLLFLLSTPLGLVINGTSWFFLGWLEVLLVGLCVEGRSPLSYFVKTTKEAYDFDYTLSYFGRVDKNNFYEITEYFEQLLYIYHPNDIQRIDYASGCNRLLRNIAFLAIVLFICSVFNASKSFDLYLPIFFFFTFFFFIVMCSLFAFYYYQKVLYITRLLCAKDNNVSLEGHVSRFKRLKLTSDK